MRVLHCRLLEDGSGLLVKILEGKTLDSLFHIGKEIGELRAEIEKLKGRKNGNCNCGKTNRVLSAVDQLNAASIGKVSNEIRLAFQKVLDGLSLKTESGGRFHVVGFTLSDKDELTTLSDPPPQSCACCADGRYACCWPAPCDPCQ